MTGRKLQFDEDLGSPAVSVHSEAWRDATPEPRHTASPVAKRAGEAPIAAPTSGDFPPLPGGDAASSVVQSGTASYADAVRTPRGSVVPPPEPSDGEAVPPPPPSVRGSMSSLRGSVSVAGCSFFSPFETGALNVRLWWQRNVASLGCSA
jgi:hypothetical protein